MDPDHFLDHLLVGDVLEARHLDEAGDDDLLLGRRRLYESLDHPVECAVDSKLDAVIHHTVHHIQGGHAETML